MKAKARNPRPLVGLGAGMVAMWASVACGPGSGTGTGTGAGQGGARVPLGGTPHVAAPPITLEPSRLQKDLAARAPARAVPGGETQRGLGQTIDAFFQRTASQRFHVHLDKPLYQPGEAIWFRVWELTTATLAPRPDGHGITAELVSPKGAVVARKRLLVQGGIATNDFDLPADVPGGEYIVRVTSDLGGTYDRTLVVSQYQPPLIKKKLEFLRKAYGAGESVSAALALHRATGEPLGAAPATAIVTVDDAEVARLPITTAPDGKATIAFALPPQIARGDGLLTILVEDGGVTESIQKRIPITMKALDLALYPEGGDLVAGLPGRVYFQAKNLLGKPADVSGRVIDDLGTEIARFTSFHHGMGHFELTPVAGRRYEVVVDQPAGIDQRAPVPAAQAEGCSMIALDDPKGERDDVRLGVWCSAPRTVIATGVLREQRLADAAYAVAPGAPTIVSLPVPVGAQGAVRVTLFSDELEPLAERLVYRGRGHDLRVSLTTDRASYAPRDAVAMTVETRDLAGKPVSADLSLAVVDDAVLAFADDKSANLMARLYLEGEMPGQAIEEPSFYFSGEPKAAQALDLVLGTQGWRRFDWQPVFAPPPPPVPVATSTGVDDGMAWPAVPVGAKGGGRIRVRKQAALRRPAARAPMAPPPMAQPMPEPVAAGPAERPRVMADKRGKEKLADRRFDARLERARGAAGQAAARDEDWAGGEALDQAWAWAPVRQFPAPSYETAYTGPRTDFRETIHWAPSVKTDASGKAIVRFHLSDAVTSFRAVAEGVTAAGLPGRGDVLVQSKLPVSLAVTMPLEVSAGDTIELPITLTNETTRPQSVAIAARFGKAFLASGVPTRAELAAGQRRSFRASLKVVGDGRDAADGEATIAIDAGNLKDEVSRTIKVVPLGFPQEVSLAGTLQTTARHEIELVGALPRTIEASIQLYPSPLATMVAGTEAMLREPGGCFEQASSSNYPNIMVLGYLEEHEAADPAIVERAGGMLDRGYKLLTGYESPQKGYEWFGGDPGHEALTAYGLMEFVDMQQVYGDVDRAMIDRTRAWLRGRRDGKGGFQRNPRALDSFGSASPEVTDAYVTYAMTEAGERDLKPELARQAEVARTAKDPYLLALATNTLLNVARDGGDARAALARLRALQAADGGFPGADHSITRSGGEALGIETTALALLAMVEAGEAQTPAARKAVDWLNAHRDGLGNFSSTQATILSLRALAAYASASRATEASGVVRLIVNGKKAGEVRFAKGHQGALVFDDVAGALRPGKNTIELALESTASLPYSVAIGYRTKQPASSAEAPVAVTQSLAKAAVPVGEGVKLHVEVDNLTEQGQPMTLARVGIPGGLAFQTWQLEELKDKGVIDFFETREREVVLYFRSLAPRAKKSLDLELLARVPGAYVAPASRAYLYYTDEHKHWVPPLAVEVTEKR